MGSPRVEKEEMNGISVIRPNDAPYGNANDEKCKETKCLGSPNGSDAMTPKGDSFFSLLKCRTRWKCVSSSKHVDIV